ncbi:MAG: hypothetical protein J6U96_04255, partial [Elusimicrobiaceae bacterium]|nr:hypothetical protein [Elusimicrobiaceae bacterium]
RALKKVRQTWPAKIKSSVNASARPLLSQLTTVEEFFPHIPGVEEVALPTVRSGPQDITKVIEQLVTGRTDLLAINESAVTAQLGSSAEVTSRVATLQNHLNTAVKNADAAFANQRGFLKHAFGDSDIAYRIELSKEVKQIGQYYKDDARGAVVDLAARIKGDYTIHVPKDLRQLREVPLFDNAGKINGQTLKVLIKTVEGVPEAQAQGELMQALNTAKNQTNLAYTHRGWLRRSWTGITGRNKTAYNKILSDNILGLMEDKNLMTSFNQAEKDKVLRTLAAAVRDTKVSLPSDLGKYAAMKYDPVNLSYRTFQSSVFSPAKTPEMLPMSFNIDKGVRGVNRYGHYQRVVFSPQSKAKGYAMGLTDGFKTTNLSNFKIDIPSSQLPTLIRGAADAKLVKPLEIKMTPYSNKRAFRKAAKLSGGASPVMENASGRTFWQQLSSGFRGKTKIWTDEVPVYIRSGKEETLVPMVFKTDTQLGLAGSRFVLDNNNNMHLLQGGQDLFGKHRLRFSLPKKQITPLVDLSRSGVLSTPLSLMVRSGRNKLAPLFWTSGLSLSAASSGLITPLETTYKDQISEQQKTFITFVFPYLPSILSPAISPFIMKYGAANVLKASLMTVAGGLAFSTLMGFRGHLDEANPPSTWPLFITAGAIGFSSAMSRSTLNVLINSMGGGGSLLKSMAFKNAGSVFLLAPSFVYGWYRLRAQPAITGKTLTEEELSKPASDFSLAFPVLLTLSLAALSWVSAARLDSSIGRASAVLRGEKFNVFGKEMGVAWRTTFAPEVLPLAAATFAFTGFESAAFSKGTNLSLKPMYEATGLLDHSKPGNRANTLALVTGISAAAVPFATRMLAKPALTALGNPLKPGIEYKRMLGLSYAFNAAGGTLLMSYGLNPTPFKTEEGKFHVDPRMVSGIVLMGLGTANVTQSFQKLANIRIGKGSTIAKLTAGMDKASAASRAKELETMTMTSFSWSQLGIAALPALQGMYVDREKAMGIRPANGPLGSLWIPMAALGASIGLALYGMYPTRLPAGLVGGTKVVVDGLQSLNPRPYQHQMAEIYRDNRAGKLDLRIMQYRIDEQKKMEAAEEKARAAAKQEVVEPEEVKEEAAEK